MPPQPQRIAVIGNPAAGRGRGAAVLAAVAARLSALGHEPRIHPTARPGHAVDLARELAGNTDLILSVGGDGTLRDVAEGLRGAALPVALIPSGTGNDFARTLSIPGELDAALSIALNGETRLIDLWSWNTVPFVNVAGVGLDAAVAEAVNQRFTRLRGTLAYLAAFFRVLPGYQPLAYQLRWPDGEWDGSAWLIACGNGRMYGGGMKITPSAVPDDGLLEVVAIQGIRKLSLLRQFPSLFRGTHVRSPDVLSIQVPCVRIRSSDHVATLDGELIGRSPAEVELAQYKLRMRVARQVL